MHTEISLYVYVYAFYQHVDVYVCVCVYVYMYVYALPKTKRTFDKTVRWCTSLSKHIHMDRVHEYAVTHWKTR